LPGIHAGQQVPGKTGESQIGRLARTLIRKFTRLAATANASLRRRRPRQLAGQASNGSQIIALWHQITVSAVRRPNDPARARSPGTSSPLLAGPRGGLIPHGCPSSSATR
jgi:hypothetical protein